MAYEFSRTLALVLAPMDSGTAADSPAIDSAFVFETSGDCFCARLVAPVSQSAATITLYVYAVTTTGTPDFQLEVRNGYSGSGDVDRPETGGADLASSPSTLSLSNADDGTWVSLTATVSLTVGLTYWLIVKNTHATPASNHTLFRYNGTIDAWGGTSVAGNTGGRSGLVAGYNTNASNFGGADATLSGGVGSVVVKFNDGTLLGQPYVGTDSAHASNTNSRGNRFTMSHNMVISGMKGTITSALSGGAVYAASGGATLASSAGDGGVEAGTVGGLYRFAPATAASGTAYDYVSTFASASTVGTILTMGEIEANVPADVLACRPFSAAYVDGATPGSFTADTSKILLSFGPLVDDFPAASGGSGGNANIFGGSVIR